jgi:F-type H+-transporting ATPase subunit delta
MRPSTTALRYAEASFAVATEAGTVQAWLGDLEAAERVLTAPATLDVFREPEVPRSDKLGLLERLLPSIRPEALNLLRLLALRDRIALLPQIRTEFVRLDREARGVVEADVTVARQYDQAEQAEIQRRLTDATGKKVELRLHIDPKILGGVVVRIGDRLIDGSISGRLQRLRHEMAV